MGYNDIIAGVCIHYEFKEKYNIMIFRRNGLIEFAESFKSDKDCIKYLAELKWANGFVCKKCGHTKADVLNGKRYQHRICLMCKQEETPMDGTIFHNVKSSELRKAFFTVYDTEYNF